jgi:hypothetical protein
MLPARLKAPALRRRNDEPKCATTRENRVKSFREAFDAYSTEREAR